MRRAVLFVLIMSVVTASGDDWPQWQGADRTGASRERGLLQEWPRDGPPLAWKATGIGEGMGGVAVSRGRIYTTGDGDGSAWLVALDEADGKQVWKAKIGRDGKLGNVFRPAGPRATPTVDGDKVYILGQHGDLVCFTTEGKEVWRADFVKNLGGIVPVWGFAESPLVDGDRLICTPGAEDATLMALEKTTGKPIWKCKVPEGPTGNRGFFGKSGAAYSSPILVEFEGKRHYVQLTATTLVGVAASDGKLLWRFDKASNTHRINCTTPLYHEGQVFATSSYDAGSGLLKLSKDGDGVKAEEVYFTRKMRNLQGGVVLHEGHLYGTSGSNQGGWLHCLDFKTGEVKWAERAVTAGSVALADGRIYYRQEDGTMLLFEPSPKGFLERGRFRQAERSRETAWPHPIVANSKLYLRDQGVLLCYDVKAK